MIDINLSSIKLWYSSHGEQGNMSSLSLGTWTAWTVRKVLADFAVYDWWCYCKALWDVKFNQIEGKGRKYSHIKLSHSVISWISNSVELRNRLYAVFYERSVLDTRTFALRWKHTIYLSTIRFSVCLRKETVLTETFSSCVL